MRKRSLHPVVSSLVLLACVATPGRAVAQDALQTVKDLYASAAYEDALTAAGEIGAGAPNIETAQYRVLCLVALGRMAEAERAVDALLTAQPEYRPDAAEASPRILGLFSDVRRRIGPGLVKRMYQLGRAAMERKDRHGAIAQFEAMLRLADDDDIRDDATVSELKELGSGFLELSRALPAKAQPVATLDGAAAAAARPAVIVPPRVIEQKLPAWVPDPINRRATEFRGAVRVQISSTGRVVSADIVTPIHPAYDSMLLLAARSWLYEPARKDGVPIAIDKTVDVVVSPARR